MRITPRPQAPSAPTRLLVGDTMPPEQMGPLTRTDFVRYAGASGDFNPVHHDEQLATAHGLPSVFGMGLLHAGKLGFVLARWVGPQNIKSFDVRFTGQVWPGDTLTFHGRVKSVEGSAESSSATIQLLVTTGDGDATVEVLRGTATVACVGTDPSSGATGTELIPSAA
jgi:acyl dehydratase